MDLHNLENLLNYEPFLNKDPQIIVDHIKQQASYYSSNEDLDEIQKAYEFSREAHKEQLRNSGEEYITHPLFATQYLMQINPDIASIQACILHDVLEDTQISYDEVKEKFGEEVADICTGLEKVGKVKYRGEERQLETLKKTFLAMAKDLRVIFIKLADRIHNLQTLKYISNSDKRYRIADETLKVFVPISQRLGLAVFQTYLENGAFCILNEAEFKRIYRYIKRYYGSGEKYITKGKNYILDILKKEGVEIYSVDGRFKSPYRIYKKLQKYQTNDISKVMDILAFRVVTTNINNCYNIMGIVHKYYTPIIKKIKDYIAVPKSNGYKSIHTTILGMFAFPVELQIRTYRMDFVAKYGVAAHFAYKEFGEGTAVSSNQSAWINRLQKIVSEFQQESNKEDFKDALQIEVLDKNIFVYTPQGDILELPKNSTVLDFAFKIHSEVGLKFKNAIVNNRIVPKDYKPNNLDFIKIQTFRNKYTASASRFNSLHTPSAKEKLGRFLRSIEKEKYIETGIELLNKKLSYFGFPVVDGKGDRFAKLYKGEEREKILMQIGNKQANPNRLIKEIYSDSFGTEKKKEIRKEAEKEESGGEQKKQEGDGSGKVVIDKDKKINYSFCPECNPKPGNKIIAKSGKDGIKIHTLSCKGLKNISYEKLLEAHWNGEDENNYKIKMSLSIFDKPGVLLSILSIFYDLGINIDDIVSENTDGEKSSIEIFLQFSNPSKMSFVIKELKNHKNLVDKIKRELIED